MSPNKKTEIATNASENSEDMGDRNENSEVIADANPPANNTEQNVDQATQPQPEAQAPQHSIWSIIRGIIFRAVIIYFISSFFRRPQNQQGQGQGQNSYVPLQPSTNLFQNGTVMDLYVYCSNDEKFSDFNNPSNLIWKKEDLMYGDWYSGPAADGVFTFETNISTNENVRNNGSLWLHVYIVKSGRSPNPQDKQKYSRADVIYQSKRLNKFKKLFYQKTHNLLTGETAASPETIKKAEESPTEILSHWHPNITINLVDDHTQWMQGHVPPPIDEFVKFEPVSGNYYPILYFNDYWNLIRDYKPINSTDMTLPLHITYQPLSLFRWQIYTAQAMRSKWTSFVGYDLMEENDGDQDSMKEAFLETSPVLLGLTFIVSIVHSIFEFLAFKNDIQFWNNRKSLEGLSVRSVFFNVFQSLVVLLYVLDNDTNLVVRISIFVGLVIDIWKIHKVTDVKINSESKIFGIIPTITLADKGSYVESSTKQYDTMAFRYLSWLLFPLLGCYAVYSVLYLEHKGWYSFILGMLYGFLLTFGFIMMTPQLFINYKLKSVAHLPWRMLTYKFLNTFIDDVFAFVIKMPTMYRIGCFRDDIVFFIYLYQRWIYRVDPKRVNEFGTSGEMEEIHQNGAVAAIEEEKDETTKKNE